MEIPFCPFIKDDCNDCCIFYSGDYVEGSRENCQILCSSQSLLGLSFDLLESDKTVSQRLAKIESELGSIYSNVSSDQTKSSSINDTLDRIEKLLERKF